MKYLFLLLFPLIVNAYDQNLELIKCHEQFSENYLLKEELDLKKNKLSSLIFEIPDFCECVVNKRKSEFEARDQDHMSWLFSGKDNRLEKEDLCAQEKFSASNQIKYFYLVFGLNMKEYIHYQLEDFYLKGIKSLATPESYYNKLACLSKNIVDACFKTQSSYISYKCIQEKIDTEYIYKIETGCPEFSTFKNNALL